MVHAAPAPPLHGVALFNSMGSHIVIAMLLLSRQAASFVHPDDAVGKRRSDSRRITSGGLTAGASQAHTTSCMHVKNLLDITVLRT